MLKLRIERQSVGAWGGICASGQERLVNIRTLITVLVILLACLGGRADAELLNIIIVAEHDGGSEQRYRQFLQEIYRGNAVVSIEPDRYDEYLSDNKKLELEAADLIVISRDTQSRQYNGDAKFWNDVNVPILNHNAKLARSVGYRFWDWLAGDTVSCDPCVHLTVSDPCDPIFSGVDISGGVVRMFGAGLDVDHSDQWSAGNGMVVAAGDGGVAIARWFGSEAKYYKWSLYGPGGPRVFFAMPDKAGDFFDDASDDALLMLKNAIVSLLPVSLPGGDIDGDADVDFEDVAVFAGCRAAGENLADVDCNCADLSGDGILNYKDLAIIAVTWLDGVDVTGPEPEVTEWESEPETVSTASIRMAAKMALDSQNGVRYYFECVSGNGPDSGWQFKEMFEPNALTPGQPYTYRVKARDTSTNMNESEWSTLESARTFGFYRYIADASAAVALDANLVIVGGDEEDFLRVYRWDDPGSAPVLDIDLVAYLNIEPLHPEMDIEGATWFGDRIFWITSHGRSRNGVYQYSRYQFYATTVTVDGPYINFRFDGNYIDLVDDLIEYDSVYDLGLADAIGVSGEHIDANTISDLAPKVDGLNIEGLCTTAEGDSIFIAFRNPRPEVDGDKHALIIGLRNPEQVVLFGAKAQFDPPILLDLDGFGIRSIEYSQSMGAYLIMAGSHKAGADEPVQILYCYDDSTGALDKICKFPVITPEAMFQFPQSSDIQLLSDDGVLLIETPFGTIENKYLPVPQRTFRSYTIQP